MVLSGMKKIFNNSKKQKTYEEVFYTGNYK